MYLKHFNFGPLVRNSEVESTVINRGCRLFISTFQQAFGEDIYYCLRIGVQELQTELLFSSQEPAPQWQRRRHLEAKGYFCSRLSHYPNSTSTFQLIRLQTSGDINLNPGPSTFKQQSCNKIANNLKIGHLNVRSLKNRDHFLLVKDTILQNKFDVLTLSETWLNSSITNLELEIPGYNLYRIDRNSKTGGGVGVYVLQTYKVKVFDNLSNISVVVYINFG